MHVLGIETRRGIGHQHAPVDAKAVAGPDVHVAHGAAKPAAFRDGEGGADAVLALRDLDFDIGCSRRPQSKLRRSVLVQLGAEGHRIPIPHHRPP
jgi:hypothetical protein